MWAAHEGMGWWMLFGGVFWLLFFGALMYAFLGVFARGAERPRGHKATPIEIAQRRLAAGEISHEEFEKIREALSR